MLSVCEKFGVLFWFAHITVTITKSGICWLLFSYNVLGMTVYHMASGTLFFFTSVLFKYLIFLFYFQAYDQHLNMILGDVEEIITTVEIDDETYEEIVRVS